MTDDIQKSADVCFNKLHYEVMHDMKSQNSAPLIVHLSDSNLRIIPNQIYLTNKLSSTSLQFRKHNSAS